MTNEGTLTRLLSGSGPVLLDFDGPVCSIFAGDPAPRIALGITDLVEAHGVTVPTEIRERAMEVLSWVNTLGKPELTVAVEDALTVAEVAATETALTTPYAFDVIKSAHDAGKPVAVVSNNSAKSIAKYLRNQGISDYVWPVVGRTYATPTEMKPNPVPVLRALELLNASPEESVFIGDSVFDVEAGVAAGVPVIGFANKPHKASTLTEAGADAIVTSMRDVAEAVAATVKP